MPLERLSVRLLLLAALCVLAYAPALSIPLMEDDYPLLVQSQAIGSPGAAASMLSTPVYRTRATTTWVLWASWNLFHMTPWAYHATSLLFHILNTWLVYAICVAWKPLRMAALWAGIFFAVHEGHQEAVMWLAANSELVQFFFGMAAFWCWLKAQDDGRSIWWQIAGICLMAPALLSKESAFILVALFVPAIPSLERKRAIRLLIPYALMSGVIVLLVFAGRSSSFRFSDGSFSLQAPFWRTWTLGYARLLWVWGWLSLAALLWLRRVRSAWPALAFIGLALVPYSFLTYSAQIPSRHVYLASFGLAMLFGLAIAGLATVPRVPMRAVAAVLTVAILANVGYLWTRKRRQFLKRAAPTEQLVELARRTDGPIWVQCFPRQRWSAEEAVHLRTGKPPSTLIWSEAEAQQKKPAAVFCFEEH